MKTLQKLSIIKDERNYCELKISIRMMKSQRSK